MWCDVSPVKNVKSDTLSSGKIAYLVAASAINQIYNNEIFKKKLAY